MDKGEKIFRTLANTQKIYSDTAKLLQMIEEEFTNIKVNDKFLTAQPTAKCTWDNSYSMFVPEKWLNKFFVRYYIEETKSNVKKAVGVCIWLYGDEDEVDFERPYISCSVVEYDTNVEDIDRDWFLYQGYYDGYSFKKDIENEILHVANCEDGEKRFNYMISYYLDLVQLDSPEKIKRYIAEPCMKIFYGKKNEIVADEVFLKTDYE